MLAVHGAADETPRLRLKVPAGCASAAWVRPALAELGTDVDPVVIEQVAVLLGALTSGGERGDDSAPFEIEIWTDPVYLAEPLIRSEDFVLNERTGGNWLWPCEYVDEIVDRPHSTCDRSSLYVPACRCSSARVTS